MILRARQSRELDQIRQVVAVNTQTKLDGLGWAVKENFSGARVTKGKGDLGAKPPLDVTGCNREDGKLHLE
ncbi:hypothetical protein TURU_094804 [Turdus rufiventris]|nr:hypothetical protein TURU_094804 [Turdus rufiventris]